jgi:hypothetical protein
MNAPVPPPFPVNPSVGERFGNWVWNGSRWVSTQATGVQVLTTVWQVAGSYPYQPSPGLISLVVECQGAGGGGGAAEGQLVSPPTADGWMCSGGGGAAGTYSRKTLPAALVLGGVVVTVGAGGAGGPIAQSPGGNGGTTSFGAFCVGNGGNGGQSNVTLGGVLDPNLGQGGGRNLTGSIGDLSTYGSAGEHGQSVYYSMGVGQVVVWGGRGGESHFQSVEAGVRQAPGGVAGVFGSFGAGGGGGANAYTGGTTAVGGRGGDGLCIVTEYCWGDAGDVVCCDPNTVNVNARVAVSQGTWDGSPCQPSGRQGGSRGFSGDPNPYGFEE